VIARQLACRYGGDPASADWCHLGRLAGFTNQKPARRDLRGYPSWVKIVHARAGLAPLTIPICVKLLILKRKWW
jgi:hypothetical protein